jgi:hypothetical protein
VSTYLYAAQTAERQGAQAGEPDRSTFLDAAVALVPAEVLALHALAVGLWADTEEVAAPATPPGANPQTHVVTTVTNESALQGAFWVLIGLAVFIFIGGKVSTGTLRPLDGLRVFIPPLAFVGWTMLQQGTAFDAVFHHVDDGVRTWAAAVGVAVLGYLAKWLGDKATQSSPPGV